MCYICKQDLIFVCILTKMVAYKINRCKSSLCYGDLNDIDSSGNSDIQYQIRKARGGRSAVNTK